MYFGIDIGGTAVKYGVIDENFAVIEKSSFPTEKSSAEALLDKICEVTLQEIKKFSFPYIGIGVPGIIDSSKGIIIESGNLPFDNTNAAEYISERVGKPVYIGNDANCAAYGEYCHTKKAVKNSVMLTLGTGIGGGIILDGKIYTGTNGYAGEIGHMVIVHGGIQCPCGKRGCFEQYASATALVRITKEAIKSGNGIMSKEMSGKLDNVDGKTVFEYAARNCKEAQDVLDKYAGYLAAGIENIIDILAPDEIVLAGGITNEKAALTDCLSKYLSGRCNLRIADLKNDAGFIGAALLG